MHDMNLTSPAVGVWRLVKQQPEEEKEEPLVPLPLPLPPSPAAIAIATRLLLSGERRTLINYSAQGPPRFRPKQPITYL